MININHLYDSRKTEPPWIQWLSEHPAHCRHWPDLCVGHADRAVFSSFQCSRGQRSLEPNQRATGHSDAPRCRVQRALCWSCVLLTPGNKVWWLECLLCESINDERDFKIDTLIYFHFLWFIFIFLILCWRLDVSREWNLICNYDIRVFQFNYDHVWQMYSSFNFLFIHL